MQSGRSSSKLLREEVISVLQTIDVTLSDFQLNSIMSELFHDSDGYISVKDATMVSAHLLQVFLAEEEGERVESEASARAEEIVKKNQAEVHRIVAYFVNGFPQGLNMSNSWHYTIAPSRMKTSTTLTTTTRSHAQSSSCNPCAGLAS